MKTTSYITVLSILCAASLAPAQQLPAEAAAAMTQAMAMFGQAAQQQEAAPAASIDPKALRALLPEKDAYPGYKRVRAASESNGVMGIQVVNATAEFEALKGNASFSIEYTSLGAVGSLAGMLMQMQEIDEETEHGFKRSVTYPGGYKAVEEHDEEDKSTEIVITAGKHVQVTLKASGLSFEAVKQILAKIDLAKIAAIQPKAQ